MLRLEINEKGPEKFYKEVVNIAVQYRQLKKNPSKKLTDFFKQYKINLILCGIFLVLLLAMGIAWGFDAIAGAAIILMIFCLFLNGLLMRNMIRYKNALSNDERSAVLTLGDKGVELNKEDAQIITIGWDNLAFVRIFDESLAFVAKDETGILITVSRRHENEILEELRSEHGNVQIIQI